MQVHRFLAGILLLLGAAQATSNTAQSVFRASAPSVVLVRSSSQQGEVQGSAVAYDKLCGAFQNGDRSRGCSQYLYTRLSTNAHVVGAAEFVQLEWPGRQVSAKVIFRSPEFDLAILEIRGDAGLPAAPIWGDRKAGLAVGEAVFAIGAPQGLERSISEGIVSGLRSVGMIPTIQTTAAISPGSSGGGLFDKGGNFVGITTFKNTRGESLNFAISAGVLGNIDIGISVKAFIERDALRAGISLPSYFSTDEFVSYLAGVKPGRTGKFTSRLDEYFEISERAESRGDSSIFVRWIEGLKEDFQPMGLSKPLVATEPEPTQIKLTCQYAQVRFDRTVRRATYTIDFQRKTVDGVPAQILTDEIRWQRSAGSDVFALVINRQSGELVVSTANFSPFIQGTCERVNERKF